jgi:type 1 glutamine amidotransferase
MFAKSKMCVALLAAMAVLMPSSSHAQSPKQQLLIITGSMQAHDWYNTTPILKKALEDSGRFQVTVTEDPAKDLTADNLKRFQVLLLHYRESPAGRQQRYPVLDANYVATGEFKEFDPKPGRWPAANEKALLDAVSSGTGLVVLHYATAAFDTPADVNWLEYETLVGGGWRASKGRSGHGPQLQFKVKVTDRTHPITKGFPAEFLHTKDELYHNSLMVDGNTVLAMAFDETFAGTRPSGSGKDEPMIWVRQHGKGRVYTNVLGHGVDHMRLSPSFLALVQRGAEWAATGQVTIPLPKVFDAPVNPNPVDVRPPGGGRGGAPGAPAGPTTPAAPVVRP